MTTLNTKTGFTNLGRGFSAAGGWVAGEWVSCLATNEGRGQRRTWHVSADFSRKGEKTVRVMVTRVDCFRYEAADAAVAALVELMAGAAPAPAVAQ